MVSITGPFYRCFQLDETGKSEYTSKRRRTGLLKRKDGIRNDLYG